MSPWQDRAACAGFSPNAFHREQGSRRNEDDRWAAFAKKVCSRCPVVRECLTSALEFENHTLAFERMDSEGKTNIWTMTHLPQGVWGGTTPTERHARHIKHLESCQTRKCRGCRPIEERVQMLTAREAA